MADLTADFQRLAEVTYAKIQAVHSAGGARPAGHGAFQANS
ncbi:MAG: hypothetical protein ACKVH0_14400 [Alphaproteobacteria bacterium]